MNIFDPLADEWRELMHHRDQVQPVVANERVIDISNVEERVAMHLAMTGESQALASTPASLETTPTGGKPVSAVADLQNFAHELAAKAAELEQTVLPAAAGHLTALEGNPVVTSLLAAAHVPPEALSIVVATIDGLEALYKPVEAVPAPAA